MPLSLRIPPEKEELIEKAAEESGKTKTGFILAAVDEKLGLAPDRESRIRQMAGWLSPEEAEKLRRDLEDFEEIGPGDWA